MKNQLMIWRRDFESEIIEPQSTPAIDGELVYGLPQMGRFPACGL
jgi:hypothetical protein